MTLIQVPTPRTTFPSRGTDWNITDFDSFINRRGYLFDLFRSHLCGCRNDRTKQPDWVCPLCLNRGDTLDKIGEVRGFIEISNQSTGLETHGIWELGEGMLTVRRDVEIDVGDTVIYKEYQNRKNELIRSKGTGIDRLRFNSVEQITRASVIAAEDVATVRDLDEKIRRGKATAAEKAQRDSLATSLEVVLQEKVDFNLLKVNNRSFIQYTSVKRPSTDAAVSVNYIHNPEFVVKDLPQDDVDHDVKIAQHRKIVRRDLDGDEDSSTPKASPEVPSG